LSYERSHCSILHPAPSRTRLEPRRGGRRLVGPILGSRSHAPRIRSYLATAARHGISALDALTRAFQASPWIPGTG